MNGTGSRQERLINYRLYAGADIHIEKSGVPSVRIYPVTEKYVDDIVVGVDPKCRVRNKLEPVSAQSTLYEMAQLAVTADKLPMEKRLQPVFSRR